MFRAGYLEFDVKDAVVDGCLDAVSAHKRSLCQSAATEAVGADAEVSSRIRQLAYVERELAHLT